MTLAAHIRALAAALAVGLTAAGCGSADEGDPIPGSKAAALEQQLDAVQAAVDEERCDDVPGAVSDLQATIGTLDDDGVGDDVRDALSDGADNLRSVARTDCEPEEDDPVETTPETVPTTPPTTPEVEPPPPPTEEVPPPTEEEPPPPPEEEEPVDPVEPPPDEGGGGGQFDPGGGGVGPDGSGPPGQIGKGDD